MVLICSSTVSVPSPLFRPAQTGSVVSRSNIVLDKWYFVGLVATGSIEGAPAALAERNTASQLVGVSPQVLIGIASRAGHWTTSYLDSCFYRPSPRSW